MPDTRTYINVVNVLMIDDKKENLYSLRNLLDEGNNSINFIETTSGNEALKIALKENLALILLDVQMPEMDGYEVARLLKLNKKTKDIPIIFVTALSHETSYVLEGCEKGAVDYLFKPLNPTITKAKVNAFIQMHLQRIELEQHKEALMEVNLNLEDKVKERTQELTKANEVLKDEIERRRIVERELLESNEKLLKINADLDSFVYTASHDLKLPVANMEGLLKMLQSKLNQPDKTVISITEMLDKSVEQFKNTIQNLLKIIRNQKIGIDEREEVNCEEVLEEIKNSIKDIIENSDAIISTDFNDCNSITLNRQELKSILYNLLTNAIKYRSPERNPLIIVKVNKQEENIILSVKDNGLGVDEENKNKMFSMFERLHSHVEGSGIGLYIVKNIIKKYNGTIQVESEPGHYTEFILKLPL